MGDNIIFILTPAVKTKPKLTYGHADVYSSREPGELYDMGSQTNEYMWEIISDFRCNTGDSSFQCFTYIRKSGWGEELKGQDSIRKRKGGVATQTLESQFVKEYDDSLDLVAEPETKYDDMQNEEEPNISPCPTTTQTGSPPCPLKWNGRKVLEMKVREIEDLVDEEIIAGPAPEVIIPRAPEETVLPAPEATVLPVPEETVLPTPGETVLPAPEATVLLVPEETVLPTPEETVLPTPEETVLPAPEETVLPTPEETVLPTPEETVLPAPEETVLPAPEETVPPAPEKTVPPGPGMTGPPALKVKVPAAPCLAIPPAPRYAFPATLDWTAPPPAPDMTGPSTSRGIVAEYPSDPLVEDINKDSPPYKVRKFGVPHQKNKFMGKVKPYSSSTSSSKEADPFSSERKYMPAARGKKAEKENPFD